MKQDQYKRVLETRLLPQVNEFSLMMTNTFLCMTRHRATKPEVLLHFWLKNFSVLPWPGNSPDMNRIQNMWELTKRGIAKEVITTKQQLIEILIRVWHHNSQLQANAETCIESMPRRIEALIAAKGSITKYVLKFILVIFTNINNTHTKNKIKQFCIIFV